mmetsp:Transcript_51501/g.95317  ORF Transcript_51501/g.95317 Transcript_51501/m.95317 type:complete len:258 (-) Transcript_51501:74-847(-)
MTVCGAPTLALARSFGGLDLEGFGGRDQAVRVSEDVALVVAGGEVVVQLDFSLRHGLGAHALRVAEVIPIGDALRHRPVHRFRARRIDRDPIVDLRLGVIEPTLDHLSRHGHLRLGSGDRGGFRRLRHVQHVRDGQRRVGGAAVLDDDELVISFGEGVAHVLLLALDHARALVDVLGAAAVLPILRQAALKLIVLHVVHAHDRDPIVLVRALQCKFDRFGHHEVGPFEVDERIGRLFGDGEHFGHGQDVVGRTGVPE